MNYYIYSLLAPLLVTAFPLRCCLASHQMNGPVPLAEHWTSPGCSQGNSGKWPFPACPDSCFTLRVPWDRRCILLREQVNINASLERVLKNNDLWHVWIGHHRELKVCRVALRCRKKKITSVAVGGFATWAAFGSSQPWLLSLVICLVDQ